jgi:lysophospholipase L1-like esterase
MPLLQLKYILWLIFHIPVLPVLALQGRRLKKAVPMLPGATKNITGSYGSASKELNIITLGESAMAGVGVDDHFEGITGQLAKTLSEHTGKKVNWQVMAKSGYTAKKVAKRLAIHLPESRIDFIVIGLGANDTFELNSPISWLNDFRNLIKTIRKYQPNCPIIISQLPPVGEFPAFPSLMKHVFGTLVEWNCAVLNTLLKEFDNLYYMKEPVKCADWVAKVDRVDSVDAFFSDGVHPSPLAYSLWGREVGNYIIKNDLV